MSAFSWTQLKMLKNCSNLRQFYSSYILARYFLRFKFKIPSWGKKRWRDTGNKRESLEEEKFPQLFSWACESLSVESFSPWEKSDFSRGTILISPVWQFWFLSEEEIFCFWTIGSSGSVTFPSPFKNLPLTQFEWNCWQYILRIKLVVRHTTTWIGELIEFLF